MKKSFLLLASAATLAIAKTSITLMPYSAYINYSGSAKKDAYVIGTYASFYNLENKLELALENINISYNNGLKDLDQNDFTAIFTRSFAKNYALKGGFHYIDSDDKATNKGLVGILGFNYYNYLKYNLGLDVYYSKYKDYKPKELKLVQVKPYAGINFGDYNSKFGSFYLEANYNYIKPNSAATFGLKKSYNSFGVKLTNYKGKFTSSIGAWAGKRVFAVTNGGFSVYNLGEVYKGGVDASFNYALNPKTNITLKYNYSKFDEANKKAHSNTAALLLSHTW